MAAGDVKNTKLCDLKNSPTDHNAGSRTKTYLEVLTPTPSSEIQKPGTVVGALGTINALTA